MHSRRRFLSTTVAGAAGLALPVAASPVLIKPPRLREGDLVGLLAPGGAMDDAQIERAVRNIESMGLRVRLGDNVRLRRGNYAGTPAQQVADLHAMFLDRDVRAIWSGRGGSGSALLLPLLDYSLIRRNAKALVGFSDTTALHLAIQRHAGVVTFHGPSGISTFSAYSVEHLRRALMEPAAPRVVTGALENDALSATRPHFLPKVIRGGVATGVLAGGNLATLASLVGTPYAPRLRGAIVFLEDVAEPPYRVNRMLTQLVQSGSLAGVAGVMLGIFTRSDVPAGEATLSLEETLVDRLEPLGIPVRYGFSFGHIAHHFTIPLGIRARMDADAGTLTLLEGGVA